MVTEGRAAHDLELVEVKAYPPGTIPDYLQPKREPFLLVFRGPSDAPLPEGIHQFRHPALGDQEIYIIPLGPLGQTDAFFYQAVFN